MNLIINQSPSKIINFSHSKVARGTASTELRYKNLETGAVLTKVIKAHESFDKATIDSRVAAFSHRDKDGLHFMDLETYEIFVIPLQYLDEKGSGVGAGGSNKDQFLAEGMQVTVLFHNDKILDLQLPQTQVYAVQDTMVRSDRMSGDKSATLEGGATIMVPGFIKNGEKIIVNLDDVRYIGRAEEGKKSF
jgi:elongation factor P